MDLFFFNCKIGNLTLWFRLTCELDVLKSLYRTNLEQWHSSKQKDLCKMLSEPNATIQNEEGKNSTKSKQATLLTPSNIKGQNERTLVALSILCIKFNATFEVSKDMQEQICVECNFIGSRRLKTESKTLSESEIFFNFTHEFPHNERNLQRLINILKDLESSIKFTVIKIKPVSDTSSENDLKNESCEVGFGLLHLGKFVNEWNSLPSNDSHIFTIPLLSKQPPYQYQNIGTLEISMEDMRKLKMLQQN